MLDNYNTTIIMKTCYNKNNQIYKWRLQAVIINNDIIVYQRVFQNYSANYFGIRLKEGKS